jgi:hypothetical protein
MTQMESDDKYIVQLRRELTRAQARLSRAERERDRLLDENRRLRRLLTEQAIKRPGETPDVP